LRISKQKGSAADGKLVVSQWLNKAAGVGGTEGLPAPQVCHAGEWTKV